MPSQSAAPAHSQCNHFQSPTYYSKSKQPACLYFMYVPTHTVYSVQQCMTRLVYLNVTQVCRLPEYVGSC